MSTLTFAARSRIVEPILIWEEEKNVEHLMHYFQDGCSHVIPLTNLLLQAYVGNLGGLLSKKSNGANETFVWGLRQEVNEFKSSDIRVVVSKFMHM